MYTEKLINIPQYLYINLCNVDENKFFDVEKLDDLYEFLYRVGKNPITIDFGYRSIPYEYFEDIYRNSIMKLGGDVLLKVKSFEELQKIDRLTKKYYVQNLFISFRILSLVDFLTSYQCYEYKLMWDYLNDAKFKSNYIGNIIIEILVDKNNIFGLYDIIKYFGQNGYRCRVAYMDKLGQGNHVGNYRICCKTSNFIEQDISVRLSLDRLNELSNYIINKNDIDNVYYNPTKNCNLNKNCDILSVDFDFKMMLCDKIFGDKCHTLYPLDCIDENGRLTDIFIDSVKSDYSSMCYGCTCQNFFNE